MAAGKHPAANKSNRSLSGRSIIMSVETVHTFLHQGITKPSRNFAALSYCPIDQQEVVRILSTPILISWHHYNRQVDFRQEFIENFFSLDMERLNCTIREPFSLKKGDTIDVNMVQISGELSISIGQENQEPIYEGRNPELSSFRVTIPEDGNYSLSVSGKQAERSISFQINTSSD